MTIIALISTLISSLALAGIAISLLLQGRQLYAAQLQAVRSAHLELIKLLIDHPSLAQKGLSSSDKYSLAQRAYFNWRMKYLELGYSLGVISPASIHTQVAEMFDVRDFYDWWNHARLIYETEAISKKARQFYAAIEDEFARKTSPSP